MVANGTPGPPDVAALALADSPATASFATVGGAVLRTPVLSVRRLPTVVAAPIAERRLRADLEAWVATQPVDTCLAVTGEADGRPLAFAHNPDLPLTPASAAKLLTGAAALRELGPTHRFRTVVAASAPPEGDVVADGPTADVVTSSPIFAPQVAKIFPSSGYLTVDEVAAFIQPHPTLSETFGETLMSLTGRSLH